MFLGECEITAYTWTGNTMANGEMPYVGCAASYDLEIGTKIYIKEMGDYIIKDKCPTPGIIDVYMRSEEECINFGRQIKEVYIYNE